MLAVSATARADLLLSLPGAGPVSFSAKACAGRNAAAQAMTSGAARGAPAVPFVNSRPPTSLHPCALSLPPLTPQVPAASESQLPRPDALREPTPSGPGSAPLALSAVLGLGALQLARSARQLGLHPLPPWYHQERAVQVRHVVAADLDFSPLVACLFDEPTTCRRLSHAWAHRLTFAIPPPVTSSTLAQSHPRAPPGPPDRFATRVIETWK